MNFKIAALILCGIIAIPILSCKADLSSDKGKVSYGIGLEFGKDMKTRGIELDLKAFTQAVEDVYKDKKPRLDSKEIQSAFQKMAREMMKKRSAIAGEAQKTGQAYLDANKIKPGVTTTASGLQYRVIKQGNGISPRPTDIVKVHYRGTFIDGKEFDSSYKRKQPVEFQLNKVIPGWTEGVQLMKTGSKYEFVVPSDLAYGPQGNQSIPGNSVLIFEVELLQVKRK